MTDDINQPPTSSTSSSRDIHDDDEGSSSTVVDLGAKLFKLRDYTPIPLIVLVLFAAEPSVRSAALGTLIAVFGELFRIYSVAFIGSVSRTRNTSSAGAKLITTGPFAFVRNPLYVGNFLICLGFAVFSGLLWVVLVTVALFAFQYYCIVKYEETLLLEKFGQEYKDYMGKVPAWIPSRLPALAEIEWPDTFSPALRSERRTLAAIAFMLIALMLISGPQRMGTGNFY